jgi:hypothetical protein
MGTPSGSGDEMKLRCDMICIWTGRTLGKPWSGRGYNCDDLMIT